MTSAMLAKTERQLLPVAVLLSSLVRLAFSCRRFRFEGNTFEIFHIEYHIGWDLLAEKIPTDISYLLQ